jgi:hypothetical protein
MTADSRGMGLRSVADRPETGKNDSHGKPESMVCGHMEHRAAALIFHYVRVCFRIDIADVSRLYQGEQEISLNLL